jgi:Flp pilus assembly protein TadG
MEAAMKRNPESGQALVFAALAMFVLIGFAGLAIDMGALRYQKRLQQTAADGAAIAGANNLAFPASGGVTPGAQNASAANGFTDNSGGTTCTNNPGTVGCITVTVNNPPLSGPHVTGTTNANKYVEVLVTVVQPTYFMKAVGIPTETITARAVATNLSGDSTSSGCLYTLGLPSVKGVEGINITGHGTLNATSCGIADDGNYDPNDPAITVNNCSFAVTGTDTGSSGSNVMCNGQIKNPTYGTPAAGDPLSYLTPPTQPAASSSCPPTGACNVSTSGTETLQPGTYSSIDFGKNSTVTLSPGIYYIDGSGGLTFEGSATVVGTGVMFYLTCSPGTSPCTNGATLNAIGGGNLPDINLTAPSATNCSACSAEYDGIVFYQDPNDTNPPSLGGDDNSNFVGALYFPSVELSFFGNAKSGGFNAGIVVAEALSLTGNPTVNLQGVAGLPTGVSILTHAVLVE